MDPDHNEQNNMREPLIGGRHSSRNSRGEAPPPLPPTMTGQNSHGEAPPPVPEYSDRLVFFLFYFIFCFVFVSCNCFLFARARTCVCLPALLHA